MGYFNYRTIVAFLSALIITSVTWGQTQLDSTLIENEIKVIDNFLHKRKYNDALNASKEIITKAEQNGYKMGCAQGLYYLGLSYYNLLQTDSAIICMTKANKLFSIYNSKKDEVNTLLKLGDYYRLNDKNDSSAVFFNRATAIAQSLNDSALLATSYYGLGRTHTQLGEYKLAMDLFMVALNIRQEINDLKGVADVINSIGIIFKQQGDMVSALDFQIKAMTIRLNIDDSLGLAYQHNNIGLICIELKQYKKAFDHLNHSIEIKKKLNDVRGISNSLMNKGFGHLNQKNYDSSLIILNQAEKIKAELHEFGGLANIYLYQGEVYRNLGQYQKSIEKLTESQQLTRAFKEPQGEANADFQLALTYLKYQRYNEALDLIDKANIVAKKLKMLGLQEQIYQTLYQLYKSRKEFEKSLEYYTSYVSVRDSILKQEGIKKVLTFQLREEFDKQIEQQNLINEQKLQKIAFENRRKTLMAYSFLCAFILVGGALLLYIHLYKQNRKITEQLYAQQHENEQQKEELILQRDQIISILTGIGDSIDYAKRIQQAILPHPSTIEKNVSDYFLINQPRDIVGGDFFWINNYDNYNVYAVADSTGHGIPGGFMSMLGISALNDLLSDDTTHDPSNILNLLRQYISASLNQTETEDINDGMDVSLCFYNPTTHEFSYSGANQSILVYTHNPIKTNERIIKQFRNLYEILPDRMPIPSIEKDSPFSTINIELASNDIIYLYSDGFSDQFGGPNDKKFGIKAFRNTVNLVKELPLARQKTILWEKIIKWKEYSESQTDDILVLAVKLK